uniref:Uncharacterized protein n=1 Tax=viral metagenome TaxID=1070528 RepID=A0A6C0ARN2_9ZZZZ
MSNITVLIVEKNGDIKESVIKNFKESELYKKAGFKTGDGFKVQANWNIEADEINTMSYSISVYGKLNGKANQENKFEFPPPIDSTLFFGNCIIVNKVDDEPVSLTSKEWDSIYEYLYGGFEDIGDEDSDDYSEDDDEDDGKPRTKSGYVKDGFVVDDDEVTVESSSDEDEEEDEDDDDEEEIPKKRRSTKVIKKKPVTQKSAKKNTLNTTSKPVTLFERVVNEAQEEPESYLDCTSELSEESYV